MEKKLGDDCFPLLEALMGEDDVVLFLFSLPGPLEVEGCFVLSQRCLSTLPYAAVFTVAK